MPIDFGALLPPGDGPSSQLACSASDKHDVVARGIQRPVIPFAWIVVRSGYFYETLIQGQVMSDRVLPALFVLSVIGKVFEDIIVNTTQCQFSFGTGTDRHYD